MRGALALLLALAGCTAQQQPEQPDSAPAPGPGAAGRVVGTVRVVGSAPVNVRVVIDPAEGKDIQLVGPLREELRQLAGAEVAVSGPLSPAPDPMADRQIQVSAYEVLSVDGRPVVTGTVEGTSNSWTLLRTEQGELVYLAGATSELRPGQKVWVQGPRGVIVQTYGVLRR